jgi:hypothetical protein
MQYKNIYSAFRWCIICDLLKMHGEDNIKLYAGSLRAHKADREQLFKRFIKKI